MSPGLSHGECTQLDVGGLKLSLVVVAGSAEGPSIGEKMVALWAKTFSMPPLGSPWF